MPPQESFLLPLIILIPLIGAVVTLFARKDIANSAGKLAFAFSLLTLALVAVVLGSFDFANGGQWQVLYQRAWLSVAGASGAHPIGVSLSLGVDAISLWLVVLTAVLTPLSILASFKYIKDRRNEFYAWMLVLHAGMLGVFCARDILLFYLFFEFTLIPMFFIIGIWGGAERRRAAGKFFLFTFAGSVLTLTALLFVAHVYDVGYAALDASGHLVQYVQGAGHLSFQIDDLYKVGAALPAGVQYLIFLGLLAGFAVKVPLFPVHTWLPLAHTEAPTAGSVILAGVLLKLGTYGILRFAVPMLPAATLHFAGPIAIICIVGIIYGALVSWVQSDMKKLIAYSSVSHLGFCVLGMFALTAEGLTGSVMYMINHGISTGALFLVVGMIYERYHTRDMDQFSGLARRLPALACFAVFFVLSSIALPGLNGFISEFLVLVGTYISGSAGHHGGPLGPGYAVFAATGVILSAVYMLYWAGRVIYGPLKEPAREAHGEDESHAPVRDLSVREWCVLTPLAVLVLVLGIYPSVVMSSLQPALNGISKPALAAAALNEAPMTAQLPEPEHRAAGL